MNLYLPAEQWCYHEDLGHYRTYGIQCWRYLSGRFRLVAQISDVSSNLFFVSLLASLCTKLALDPGHLRDVVQDAIS